MLITRSAFVGGEKMIQSAIVWLLERDRKGFITISEANQFLELLRGLTAKKEIK